MRLILSFSLFFLTAFCNCLSAQSYKLAERNGFRDAKLGMFKSDLPGLYELPVSEYDKAHGKSNANRKTYTRLSDKLEIGPYKVYSIEYIFYKDRLSSIRLFITDMSNVTGIRDVLLEEYGPAQKLDYLSRPCLWQSGDFILKFDRIDMPGMPTATVYFYNESVSQWVVEQEKQRNKAASSDL